jgi:hypothetical protein
MDPQHCLQVVVHTPSEVKTIALAQADTQVSLLTFFRYKILFSVPGTCNFLPSFKICVSLCTRQIENK